MGPNTVRDDRLPQWLPGINEECHMGRKADAVVKGVNVTAKILVSLLWVAVCIVGFAAGQPLVGIFALLYLIYLWVLNGRWLIY
jgi:hypothetical protein